MCHSALRDRESLCSCNIWGFSWIFFRGTSHRHTSLFFIFPPGGVSALRDLFSFPLSTPLFLFSIKKFPPLLRRCRITICPSSQKPLKHATTTNKEAKSCHRPLSRASRKLFRKGSSHILIHYFGGKGRDAHWRRHLDLDVSSDAIIGRRREITTLVDDPNDELTDK